MLTDRLVPYRNGLDAMARRSFSRSANCPECGHVNRANARMCTRCLTSLTPSTSRAQAIRADLEHDEGARANSTRLSRRTRTSRAEALRQRVLGASRESRSPKRLESSGWLGDWKLGGMVLAFLGIIGLRHGGDLVDQVQDMNDGEGPFSKLF